MKSGGKTNMPIPLLEMKSKHKNCIARSIFFNTAQTVINIFLMASGHYKDLDANMQNE